MGWSCVHKPVGGPAQSSSPTSKRREHTKPTPNKVALTWLADRAHHLGVAPRTRRACHVLSPFACLVPFPTSPSLLASFPFPPSLLPLPCLPCFSFHPSFCSFFLSPPLSFALSSLLLLSFPHFPPTSLSLYLCLCLSRAFCTFISFCPQPPPATPRPFENRIPKRESCLSLCCPSLTLFHINHLSPFFVLPSVVLCLPLQSSLPMMSKNQLAYHHHHRQLAAAASTIASPLPSPAMSLNDSNPWANITTPSLPSSNPTHHSIKGLSTPSVVYSNSTQPIISFEGSSQPKNVINDVFLSSTMLYDDVERYLHESSSSSFDSDSDSGFSTPSQHDEEHQNCFSTPMTPMSPFMENDTEDQLYPTEEEDVPTHLPEQTEQCQDTKQETDGNNIFHQQLFSCDTVMSFLRSPHNRSPVRAASQISPPKHTFFIYFCASRPTSKNLYVATPHGTLCEQGHDQ